MSALKDKVVLITGASSGIGLATAVLFAEQGAKVVGSGRNEANLEKMKAACLAKNASCEVLLVTGDVTKEADVERLVNTTLDHFKQLDVLVNNAGIIKSETIETTSLANYDNVMNVNVRSVYHLTMLCVPHLVKSKGNIVNVSSVAGSRSFPGVLSYCMSKAAIDQMTKCIALELSGKGVRVNSVNPGVIVTEIHKRGGMEDEKYAAFLEHSKTTHALGRVGQPQEVAEAIVFLSDNTKSGFITASAIPVDGGRHAMCPR